MVLQVLGILCGLPSSGRNFSKAVDAIVLKLGYKSTPYDPKFFCKWIGGMPILVVFHSDDFCWCGPPSTFAGRVGFSCSSFRGIKVQSQRLYHGAFRGDQCNFR